MATNTTIPQDAILNPYTPLAFMAPDVADQFQAMCYVNVAVLAVSSMQFLATIDLISYTRRLTLGIGSWQFQKNTQLSANGDSNCLILRILERGLLCISSAWSFV
jgi:hypothetical protein